MEAPPPDGFWQYIAHLATAAALAIGAFVMRSHIRRVEEMERSYVSRKELKDYMDQIAEERQRMHAENRTSIDSLTNRIDNILHRRA